MHKPQPQDEWVFLRPDEFTDDGDLEAIDAAVERGPEERAMHVERLRRPVMDPSRTDVETGMTGEVDEMPVTYFDDEEPELGPRPDPSSEETDHEPDLEELLESQHYAFEPGGEA
jgi:hypothetical protein